MRGRGSTVETLVELEDGQRERVRQVPQHRLEEPAPREVVHHGSEIENSIRLEDLMNLLK